MFCRIVSWDAAQSALCSRASLWCEVARTYQNGCPACRWYLCEPQGLVILQAVSRGIEGVPRPFFRDLDRDVVQVARGVGVVGDERGDVLCHPPEDRQDDVLHHFRWREGVEAPVVHRRQAQLVLALQGELPVRLQLEPQVGDGVRRWYPVPLVFQVKTEAQLQARDPLRGGHGTPVNRSREAQDTAHATQHTEQAHR